MSIADSLMTIERYISKCWAALPQQSTDFLSYNEYWYLQTIEEHGELRLSDLATLLQLSKPSVTSMVAKLERTGLVERSTSAEDGRVVLVRLSKAGSDALKQDSENITRIVDGVAAKMDKEDIVRLEGLLRKFVECTRR